MPQSDQQTATSRRDFLSTSLAATTAIWWQGSRTDSANAIEPIQREGSKFKFSLAAYSYRKLLQGDAAELTLFDFVDDCARFGLDGTELTSYYFPAATTPAFLRRLKQHCFWQGLDVSGTAVGNDFGHPPGPKNDEQMALVQDWIERAELLGAPVIRIFAGHDHGDASPEQFHARIVKGIEASCQSAGEHGTHLALENHGGPTATAEGLLKITRDVSSPWFGVNLDTGNFHSDDVYGDLARVAPFAINVQVKAMISGPDGKPQPADYGRLADILRAANYRGYVVLEYEEAGDPRAECERHLDALRAAFGV